MYTVITTVGTSLLRNYCKLNEGKDNAQTVYNTLEDGELKSYSYWDGMKGDVQKVRDIVLCWLKNINYGEIACAELKSLYQIKKEKGDICVHLITTDTVLSYLSAELICEALENKEIPCHPEIHCIKGLQVQSADVFKSVGMPNLLKKIKDIKKNRECILNISGGYKALIPYLTIMGQLYGMNLYYVYENSNELITIPVLPFDLDWVFAEKVYEPMHSENLNGLDSDSKVFKELFKYSLVDKQDNRYRLTGLGNIIKDYINNEYNFSRQALGHYMEYKVLEYYIEHPYEANNKVYLEAIRSVDIKFLDKKSEIDVVLSVGNGFKGSFIAIESKLYSRLTDNKELEEKLYKKVDILNGLGKTPDEFHLCVFLTSDNQEDTIKVQQKYDERFRNIAEQIRTKFPECCFKVFIAKNILSEIRDKVNYQNIARKKLDEKIFNLYREF
ncbi:MAG: hypothetical protein ACOX7R_00250 [Acetivibrionales bacterium]